MTQNVSANSFNKVIGPLLLMLFTPIFAMLMWYTNTHCEGSFLLLIEKGNIGGWMQLLNEAWFSHFFGSPTAWIILGAFAALQILFMKIIPGKIYHGTITPKGNLPQYKDNGLAAYLLTFVIYLTASKVFNLFNAGIIFDHYGDILGALNLFALIFCLLLYFKGKYAPSSTDHGETGNFVFDYYWGRELYPRILGIDIKQFTNCRFGMIWWALSVVSFAFAKHERTDHIDYGVIISALLIFIYLFKFFLWEKGYMRSIDIIVDRAGYYICWGCLVWVPAIYTSPTMFLTNEHVQVSLSSGLIILFLGLTAIFINYWADKQRQAFRETNGIYNIWGKQAKYIKATYTTDLGEEKSNLLLASGFWGISRHFHYIPELAAAFFWSCAGGFDYFAPYFYVCFLAILLFHRAKRDDEKCTRKYGESWKEYKQTVPYKIIPGVY